jgi:hypothetical protein
MKNDWLYNEHVSSPKTEALFLVLSFLFLCLTIWRTKRSRFNVLTALFFFFFAFFLFYTINYKTLNIRLTSESLKLTFGIFTWTIPLDNIAEYRLDEVPTLMRLGGAGIHFMMVHKRYRASFNFLEHPRVVIAFKKKIGPVQDISFSTRQPQDVLQDIHEVVSLKRTV